jgi:hypothetical protein
MMKIEMPKDIPKKTNFNSWILNEDTCLWEAPVAKKYFIYEF